MYKFNAAYNLTNDFLIVHSFLQKTKNDHPTTNRRRGKKPSMQEPRLMCVLLCVVIMEPNEGLKNHGVHLMIGSLQITSFMFIFVLVLRLYSLHNATHFILASSQLNDFIQKWFFFCII